MERRQFLNWVGIGFLATSLPVAIAACDSGSSDSTITGTDGEGTAVGTLAQLAQDGSILNESSANSILVIADPNADGSVVAVNPTCTHAGCAVEWDTDRTQFICPCHDSKFDTSGAVTQGPATKPLTVYSTIINGEQILVQTS
ncbi:MAG: ubiquinol-cytochrome c reductase iron-sulfur subunit [Thainema sp.]